MTISMRPLMLAALVGMSSHASASLVGSAATCANVGPIPQTTFSCDSPAATVVTPAAEFNLIWGATKTWSIDVESDSIQIAFLLTGALFQWTNPGSGLVDINVEGLGDRVIDTISIGGEISNFSANGAASLIGDVLKLDLGYRTGAGPVQWREGSSLTISLVPVAQVPEPGTLALVGAALAGLALRRSKG